MWHEFWGYFPGCSELGLTDIHVLTVSRTRYGVALVSRID